MEYIVISKNERETMQLASKIAPKLVGNDVITLTGDLGAGKTTFVKGLAKALGVKEDVISPTFNILKCYFSSKPNLFHIDAYRLENIQQDLGLEEFIDGDGICVIEWPNYISTLLPSKYLEVRIENIGESQRKITFVSHSSHFDEVIKYIEGNKK